MFRRGWRITVLALLLLLVPVAAVPQPAGKVPRVGILWAYSPSVTSILADARRLNLDIIVTASTGPWA